MISMRGNKLLIFAEWNPVKHLWKDLQHEEGTLYILKMEQFSSEEWATIWKYDYQLNAGIAFKGLRTKTQS